jgi:hypothetical protein
MRWVTFQRRYRVNPPAALTPPAPTIPTLPSTGRWQALLEQARLALHTARDEMLGYRAARSQAWKESERAEALEEQIEELERSLEGSPRSRPQTQHRCPARIS